MFLRGSATGPVAPAGVSPDDRAETYIKPIKSQPADPAYFGLRFGRGGVLS
jgi:hypothetical protein